MWVFVLFHVFSSQNSCLDISFYLAEVQLLNQVEKLENTQYHEDLMLFSLDNGRGQHHKSLISLKCPTMSQLLTMVVVNHEGLRQSQGLWSTMRALVISNISSFSIRIPIITVVDITMAIISLIKEIIFRSLIKIIIFRDLIIIFIYNAPN